MHDLLANSKILVVGGAGFVGSNLLVALLEHPVKEIVVVDNLLSSNRENIPEDPRIEFIEGSITHDETLSRLPGDLDYVFHLATFHGNQSSIHDPIRDHDNNTLTTLKLFEWLSRNARVKKVVYSSAGCSVAAKDVEDHALASKEDSCVSLDMDSPYSISKIIGEFYSVYYFKQCGLPTVRARFQNVYGPREYLGAGEWRGTPATVWRNVIPVFIWKSLHGEPLPLENGGEGSRDFIFVEDIVKGLLACALHGSPGDVYNLASGKEILIKELATEINRISGNTTPCQIKPRRGWDHSIRRFGSSEKSERELGFKAQVSLAEGLERTIAWTRNAREEIQRCIDTHRENLEQYELEQ